MERFEVASLDEEIVRKIQEFESSLQKATGHEVALVAYAADDDKSPDERGSR
jgi:hypothetical protein